LGIGSLVQWLREPEWECVAHILRTIIYLTYTLFYISVCDSIRSNSEVNLSQRESSVSIHRETTNTIQRIAELTDKPEAVIVDKAISEYLATELRELNDSYSSGNELTVEYNGEVVYTSSFGYDISSDELVETVSQYIISEGDF
jgi:vacuolar-type H+-ATPase subunit E/Vma4